MTHKAYGYAWRKIRKVVLLRDGYHCQIRGPRCTDRATQVDHITPLIDGGAWLDPRNLRAACATCNIGRPRVNRFDRTPPSSRAW